MITVLHGPNKYAINQKLIELKTEFIKKYGEHGVETLDPGQLEPDQLSSMLTGVTLFSSNRFVVIRDLISYKALAEQLGIVLKSIPEEVEVVLLEKQVDKRTSLYKFLKKEVNVYEFSELDEVQLTNWIQAEVKSHSGIIDTSAARFLTQYIGLDQSRALQEINKLIAYDPIITKETIKELVEPSSQDST